MELKREVQFSVDISTEASVLTYTYTGTRPIEVVARVDLGTDAEPISGVGGNYRLLVYLDDAAIMPASNLSVDPDRDRVVLVSRTIPLEPGDEVVVKALGLAGDVAVGTICTLRDVTPLRVDEVVGDGTVIVDHDYLGADSLAVQSSLGNRVDGATLQLFRAEDYNANRRSPEYIVARTSTNVHGRWLQPMTVDPATYVLLIYKQNEFQPRAITLTVTAPS
jgi:hypothetical protein